MFNLFKKKRKSKSELDFFKKFFRTDYNHFYKVHFPILIYPDLPSKPIFKNWRKQRHYILNNLIPQSFKGNFEKEYSAFKGSRFELIKKDKNGDINITKQHSLVYNWLDSQQRIFKSKQELELSEFAIEDFNVFVQYLDYTPQEILKSILESISAVFNNSEVVITRAMSESERLEVEELILKIESIEPYFFLDGMYDKMGDWELLQPEESSFLIVGTSSNELAKQLENKGLEIEEFRS